jgi:hypothetical protein
MSGLKRLAKPGSPQVPAAEMKVQAVEHHPETKNNRFGVVYACDAASSRQRGRHCWLKCMLHSLEEFWLRSSYPFPSSPENAPTSDSSRIQSIDDGDHADGAAGVSLPLALQQRATL